MHRIVRWRQLATALITAVAYMASSVEVLLPEVHDGDAITRQVILSAPAPTHAQGASNASHETAGSAGHDLGSAPSNGPLSHHGPHVDHCGHGHGVAPPMMIASVPAPDHDRVPTATQASLASVVLTPHSRPPIR